MLLAYSAGIHSRDAENVREGLDGTRLDRTPVRDIHGRLLSTETPMPAS